MKLIGGEKTKNILIFLGGFLIGILSHYFKENISLYINQPKISGKIRSVVFQELDYNKWEIISDMQIENSGNSPTFINIKNLELEMPELFKQNLQLKINKNIALPERNITVDTTHISLPQDFNIKDIKKAPKLNRITFQISSQTGKRKILISADTSDVNYLFHYGLLMPSKDYLALAGSIYDSAGQTSKIVAKRYYIKYKDKVYLNHVFPENIKVEHEIKNDTIFLEFYCEPIKTVAYGKSDTIEGLFANPIFMPHPKLKEKIAYPEREQFGVDISRYEPNKIKFENLVFDIESDKKKIIYIFK